MKGVKKGVILAVLVIAALVVLFPIVWVFLTALKSRVDTFAIPPVWIFMPRLKNYIELMSRYEYGRYFFNTLIV